MVLPFAETSEIVHVTKFDTSFEEKIQEQGR